jgi:hypothetical protein
MFGFGIFCHFTRTYQISPQRGQGRGKTNQTPQLNLREQPSNHDSIYAHQVVPCKDHLPSAPQILPTSDNNPLMTTYCHSRIHRPPWAALSPCLVKLSFSTLSSPILPAHLQFLVKTPLGLFPLVPPPLFSLPLHGE